MTPLKLQTLHLASEVQSIGFTKDPVVATRPVSCTHHARYPLVSERSLHRTDPVVRCAANRESTFAGTQAGPNLDRGLTACSALAPGAGLQSAGGERAGSLMWCAEPAHAIMRAKLQVDASGLGKAPARI